MTRLTNTNAKGTQMKKFAGYEVTWTTKHGTKGAIRVGTIQAANEEVARLLGQGMQPHGIERVK